MGLEVVEALTPCTKQPQKQDVRFRQTTAAMLEVLTYTPSIAEARMLAIGTSNTVTKGDGNSRSVGSKRRDSRRPVRPRTCPKKPKKKSNAT